MNPNIYTNKYIVFVSDACKAQTDIHDASHARISVQSVRSDKSTHWEPAETALAAAAPSQERRTHGGTSHSDPFTTPPAGTTARLQSDTPQANTLTSAASMHAMGHTSPSHLPSRFHLILAKQQAGHAMDRTRAGATRRRVLTQDMRRLQRGHRAREKLAQTSCRGSSLPKFCNLLLSH